MAESYDILQSIFEEAPDAVLVVDAEGVIELASPAAETVFRYPPHELVGRAIELLIPDTRRDEHVEHRKRFAVTPQSRPMGIGLDLYARRSDGSVFPVDVSLVPTNVGGKVRIGAFVRDATDRRRGVELLRAVNELTWRLLAGEPTDAMLTLACHHARVLLDALASWSTRAW